MKNRSSVQVAALFTGVVFVLVGILGFVPGITAEYADLSFAGHESEAHLVGLFLHVVLGLGMLAAGLALPKAVGGATAARA
jgi:hypothetical protein